ncbi:MAG: PEP-utilizing enzyme [archaeon]
MEKHNKANQYKDDVKVAIETREEIEKIGPLVDTLARKIADEVSLRAKLDNSFSRFISIDQIDNYLKKKIVPDSKNLSSRSKYFIVTNEGILPEEFENYLARKNYSLKKIDLSNITTIKGNPAYPGVVRGIVKIIKNKDSFGKLNEGEILVTGMTTPDFLPVMKKTAGFITDEGGITCHAAIVARELKKPCIIGTKIATEVLKDGDLVEVDANNGIVKILESSKVKVEKSKSDLSPGLWKDSFRWKYEAWPFFTSVYLKASLPGESSYYVPWPDFVNKFENGHLEAYLPKKEILSKGKVEIDELIRGDDYFAKEFRLLLNRIHKAISNCEKVRKDKNYSELNLWWPEVQSVLSDVAALLFGFDYTLNDWMKEMQTKDPELFSSISSSIKEIKPSFINEAINEVVSLVNKYPNDFDKVHSKFIENFSWFQNSYAGEFDITKEWLRKFYEENKSKVNQNHSSPKASSPKKYKLLCELASEAVSFRDDKKKLLLIAVELMNDWLRENCEKNSLNFDEMKWLSVDEVVEAISGNKKITAYAKKCASQNKRIGLMVERGYEDVSEDFFNEIGEVFLGSGKIIELRGMTGNKGKIVGKARVILDAKKEEYKLQMGDILVTSMTRPEFLPLMNKAAAFVTDEGGITCHAAIVAREMNKPCIISTKTATQIIKDGDLIEVDANTGIVKILESSIKKKSLTEPIELSKIYSREKSLLYYRMWSDSDRKGYEKYLNHKVKNNLFIISKSGEKGSVWYSLEELKEIEKKFLEIYEANPKIIQEILKDIAASWKVLQKYLSSEISSLNDFKKYYSNLVDFWAGWNTIINVPDYSWVLEKDKQRVLDSRKETENYTEQLSSLLTNFVEKEFPSLKEHSFFIDVEEFLNPNPNIMEKLLERKNGCFLLNGKLYPKNELENVLNKNNLKLGVESNPSLQESSKEKYFFARERPWLFNPVYWNPVVQTSKEIEAIYGTFLSVEWNIYKEGRMRVIIPQEEWDRIGVFIANKMFSDKQYFDNLVSKTKSAKKEIDSFLIKSKKQDYSKCSLKELNSFAKEIYSLFMKYDSASVFSWFIAGDLFKEKVHNKLGLSWEDFEIVSLPEEKTFVSKLDEDLLKASLLKNPTLQAANLSNKYYWVPFGYDGPSIWGKEYFLEKINSIKDNTKLVKKELEKIKENDLNKKKKIKIILNKISKDKQAIELLKRMHYLTLWTDERKMLEFQLFYYYNLVLERIGKLTGFSVIQLKHLTVEELLLISQEKNSLIQKANDRINNPFLTIIKKGKVDFCTNEEYNEMYEKIENQLSSTELKGTVACKGPKEKYVAKVKVASSPKDGEKLLEGEFLVASMTTPEYIVSMKKAIGFITDEGGVTCHAAIVAREMNKPCVIGTKVATKVLKDGDLVEVDANTGIIKKIS